MRTARRQESRVRRGGLLWVVMPVLAWMASGCGYIGAGVALALATGGDGGGGTAAVEPVAILGDVGPRVIGTITIDYQVQDANHDRVDIEVDISPDGGFTFVPATISNPDAGTVIGNVITGVDATGTLADRSFDWDSAADLGNAAVTTVQLRITPTDATGLQGQESVSGTLTTGNDAPEVEIAALGISTGIVPVEVTVYDSTLDDCDLLVERSFSTDGGATFSAYATATILFPNPQGIASEPRPAGRIHTFAWDSVTDVGTLNALVRLRVTPDDAYDVGTAVVSNDFDISNNDAPAAFINDLGRQDGIVQVDFVLVDPQQDLADVVFDFTLDTADPPDPASFVAVTIDSGATTGLDSDGRTHSVFWDSGADLGANAVPDVRLRITPSDLGGSGTEYLTPFFVVGNDPPSVSVRDMSTEVHEGLVTLQFDLSDTTGDFCDLTVAYTTDGSNFQPATIAVGATADVASAPGAGVRHNIAWATMADLGIANEPTVEVQITPCDDPTGTNVECGGAGSTMTFAVNNSEAPAAYIAFPLAGDVVAGDASITYLLFQADSQPVDITMEFSPDGGSSWGVAVEGPGSEGTVGLVTSPGGTTHLFVWDTKANLIPTQDYPDVLLRLSPDLGGTGVPHTSGSFLVNNNGEPTVIVGTPASPQTLGLIDIDYAIEDAEGDLVEVAVDVSTDGGASFAPATDAGPGAGSDGITALSSSPTGTAHRFVWDSLTDLVALDLREDDVIARITPTDNAAFPALGRGPVARTIAFSVDNTDEPILSIDPVTDQAGNVVITYTLVDDESSAIAIVVEVSTDGGGTYEAAEECTTCTTPPSDGVSGLSSSPVGEPHTFVWDSVTDLGRAFETGVLIRMTPSDTKTGGGEVSNPFDVDNNDAPVTFVNTPSGNPRGDVVISYTLTDTNGDPADILPRYSIDGGFSFALAAEKPGLPSEGVVGLSTSPTGVNHIFVWDSIANIGYGLFTNVVFQIRADDTDTGSPADSGVFTVNNQALLPVAEIDPISRSFTDDVTITYRLFDGDSDPSDILVEWQQDGGPWSTATEQPGLPSEGTTGLSASPAGEPHTFVWDSATDLTPGAQSGLVIRIIPTDADGQGAEDMSNSFIRGNDVPAVTITSPAPSSNQSGLIEFTYDLVDSTSDAVDLVAQYDAGSGFVAATISVGETTDLTSSPTPGTPHDLAWNSVADLGIGNYAGVVFRLTPRDFPPPDGTPGTVTIDVSNNDLPISFIGSPSGGDLREGDVPVSHVLIDGNSDTITVDVEFSVDGWVTVNLATLANTDEGSISGNQITGLSSSPDGIGHSFDWLSGSDFAGRDTELAQLRITPQDPQNFGNAFTTANFLVNNNDEPASIVPTPAGVQVGSVTLSYELFDGESDSVDIGLLFSTDGAQSFAVATEVTGPPSEGMTGLSASPGGNVHTFVWDTVADSVGISAAENDVILRVVPSDNANPALGEGPPGQTDIFTVDNTTAPTVAIAAITSPQTGDMVIDYTLTDAESALQNIVVEYSSDGGNTFQVATECTTCTSPVSEGTTGLSSSPTGDAHVFRWETATDLGPAFVTGVIVRIATTDTKTGTDTSNVFDVDNNDAPVAFVNTPSGNPRADVVISYTLTDTNGDDADILARYSIDGGSTFAVAAEQPGLPSEGTVGLSTSPTGVNHIFVWDSIANIGYGSEPNVVFQVQPTDTDMGSPANSGVFEVENLVLLPLAEIDPISRSFTDDVTITYRLIDGDSDPCDIAVDWKKDSGPWSTATEKVGLPSEGKTGLSASPAGDTHTFVWDSATDLTPGAQSGLVIRITPTDSDGLGTAGASNSFIRGNDVPSLTITSPTDSSTQSGLIEFAYDLVDSTSDAADLLAEYNTGSGFVAATISVGETVDLTSSPTPGTPHVLAWNSVADLGIGNFPNVVFRLTPRDFPPPDGTADTVTIDVENNDLPISFIGSPAAGDVRAGSVTVSHILIDGNSDSIDITVEYWDGAAFVTAVEDAVPPSEGTTGLSSSPDGMAHIFLWDTGVDFPLTDFADTRLRIQPHDGQNFGVEFITGNFHVNNNSEPEVIAIGGFTGDQTDNVPIDYTLADAESDSTTIAVTYSIDGGATYSPATLANPDEGTVSGNEIAGLSTTSAGVAHSFDWVSGTDLAGARETGVVLRIEPRDHPLLVLGLGVAGQTSIFTVDNTVEPAVNNLANASFSGTIQMNYNLFDTEPAASVDLEVTFSTDSGSTWEPASISNPLPDGSVLGNLIQGQVPSSTSPGAAKTFDWDSLADIGPTNLTGVIVRVVPMDTKIGAAAEVTFNVLNNDLPGVSIVDVSGIQSGDVNIAYQLADSYSDTLNIEIEARQGGGLWSPITESTNPASEGKTALGSAPLPGAGHLFIWDSFTDLSTTYYDDVEVRIRATDPFGTGAWASSNVFIIDNALEANLVLGKGSFFEGAIDGRGLAGTQADHQGLHFDGTRLFIGDARNNRVLIFDAVPTSDFETADVVVGQVDFTVNEEVAGGLANGLRRPMGVYSDGTILYVADSANHRVLVWNSIPTVNGVPPDHVLGQADLVSNSLNRGGPVGQDTLYYPYSVFGDSSNLYVSDTSNNRVLIWALPIDFSTEGPPADWVLGQDDFTSNSADRGGSAGANTLDRPGGLFSDGTTLFCSDRRNNRVLQWQIPGTWTNGQDANRVLGQEFMTTEGSNSDTDAFACSGEGHSGGLSRRTLYYPYGVCGDAGHVYVADRLNHRVLVWNTAAPATYACADVVLGQPDGLSQVENNGGISATSLMYPSAVTSTGTKLLIYDQNGTRVKIHDPIPVSDNAAAQVVFGQKTFATNQENHAETDARSFRLPAGLETNGTVMFLADTNNHRVLGWSSTPRVNFKNANLLFGHSSFTDFTEPPSATATSLRIPYDVAYDAVKDALFVADTFFNRIVVYAGPFSVGQAGDAFIGQTGPTGSTSGTAQDKLDYPTGVSWDGSYLWVADMLNHRVLRFSTFTTGAMADIVIGQADFVSGDSDHSGAGDPEGDQSLDWPADVVSTGSELIVADRTNNRVLIWNPLPVTTDEPASVVVGRSTFIPPGAGTTRSRLYRPTGVESDGIGLYVSDGMNNRILIWDTIPVTNGADADRIIGQPHFTTRTPNNGGVSARSIFFSGPFSFNASPCVADSGSTLWVPDVNNNRVLRYDISP